MKLPRVKDKVLSHIINSELYDMSSHRIKCDLEIDHYLVITALLELRDSELIEIIETSTTGSGKMKTYSVSTITARGYYFNKNKSFYYQSILDGIKDFVKSYLALLVFFVTIIFNLYQIFSTGKEKAEWKLSKQQLDNTLDSLRNAKTLGNHHNVETKNIVDTTK